MLYFRDKTRAETWEYRSLAVWVVLLNIFVSSLKRCTSSDVENKHAFKAGANADAGAQKFYVAGGRNDELFGAGGLSGSQKRDRDARSARSYTCILIPEATSGPTRKDLRAIADQNRRGRNALRFPPPARRILAAE